MRQGEGKHSASSTFTIPQSNTLFNFLILGWGGRNFCPPSLSDSDFSAAAEFRISLCEMRRQEKRCCAYPALPCAHNRFAPFIIITYFGLYHNRIYNTIRYVKINLLK